MESFLLKYTSFFSQLDVINWIINNISKYQTEQLSNLRNKYFRLMEGTFSSSQGGLNYKNTFNWFIGSCNWIVELLIA